ncbi:hypothetical protein EIN_097830 [Entamoeba invadens IP1]|uniref:Maelstrom domain-containing protein n=1 Tax=Entamoeba invadens IP1 TaxID=370355 RepID=A0A0A1U6P6_ENTIV|nr:hypothetical protein EIN_097830 [Entamoeba invadens IP1]ELP87496.1 hypothetical protein EIN_097830 [Entamoeba invadens IP1]|eukprot:XP_004254267.1 hypothetical protein EIN_097830 [Entamoeba invadens IP1]
MTREELLLQTLQGLKTNIERQPFFVIDFQFSYKTDVATMPVEVAIKPFLLGSSQQYDGFHQIINRPVPFQYFLNALHYTDFEHGVSSENNPVTQTDFETLWKKMNAFVREKAIQIGQSGMQPIILATPRLASEQCIDCIATLAKVQDQKRGVFKTIYAIDDFINAINKLVQHEINSIEIFNFYKPMFGDCDKSCMCSFHQTHMKKSISCSKTNTEYFTVALYYFYKNVKQTLDQLFQPPQPVKQQVVPPYY